LAEEAGGATTRHDDTATCQAVEACGRAKVSGEKGRDKVWREGRERRNLSH
jgi:hypothetical protein